MIQIDPKFKFADLFCGAGGFTTGAEQSGFARGAVAINHWRPAVSTHRQNHPHVRHICASIDHVDPKDFTNEGINLLLASPECVGHSNARGSKPINDQRRATAWCVPRWAEALRPDWIVVENVCEFKDWSPLGKNDRPLKSRKGEIFQAWLQAIRAHNYHVEARKLEARDFGAASARERLFVIARRGRSTKPIPWPAPTHDKENWTPAYSIIDWSLPTQSIFARPKALCANTIARIEYGIRKFCRPDYIEPFLVYLRGTADVRNLRDPLPTVTGSGNHFGLAVPFIVQYHNGPDGANRTYSVGGPLPTIDTQPRYAVAMPFVVPNFGERDGQTPRSHDPREPLPTVTPRGAGNLCVPFVLPNEGFFRGNQPRGLNEPLPTITASRGAGHLITPFITKYYGTGKVGSVFEPLGTVTTRDRYGLALVKTMEEHGIVDVHYRMFATRELGAAMGLGPDYFLHGTDTEQKAQIGNMVHPFVSRAIIDAIGRAA